MTPSQEVATPFAAEAARCRSVQRAWQCTPARHRLHPVRAFRRLLVREVHALCEAVARDLGKPADEVLATEILPLAEACRFLERRAARLLRPRRVPRRDRPLWLWGQRDVVHRRPRGVVGIIGTWNYPLYLNGVQLVQALTAGNGVLWKPSEVAPHSARALARLVDEADFPDGLVQVLSATREAGKDLADADVDHVVFTGSSAVGRRLAEHLGRRLVSSTLELSGCDALFVLADADIGLAAKAAWFGATLNRGQTCLCTRRALVHRDVYPAFVDALRPLVATARPVSLALDSQVEQADRLVQSAVEAGARVVGERNGTSGYQPVAIADVRPEMAICREASFAPLLTVSPFDTLDDALRMEAQCPYALGAAVFTADTAQAAHLAGRLRTGSVVVNDVIAPTAHPATPFGGRYASGWGVTQGAEGLLEMTVPQVVSIRGGTYRPHYATAEGKPPLPAAALYGLLQWGHAASFGARLHGFFRTLRGFWSG